MLNNYNKMFQYVLQHKRSVVFVQGLLQRKVKENIRRFCNEIVEVSLRNFWRAARLLQLESSVLAVQSAYRSHIMRQTHLAKLKKLESTVAEQELYMSAQMI